MSSKHEKELKRLNRIEGQVRGIRKMIEEGRYCVDVATQIKAARSALKEVGLSVLDAHLRTCVTEAVLSKKEQRVDEKIKEVIGLAKSWD
jgi:DNA-binding FrmR family transcriptional regulator